MPEERTFDEIEADFDELESGAPDEFKAAIRKLGRDIKRNREKYAPIADAFGTLAEGDRDFMVTLAKAVGSDPATAARLFVEASKSIAGHESVGVDWNELAGITPPETPPEETEEMEIDETKLAEMISEAVTKAVGSELTGWQEKQQEESAKLKIISEINDKLKNLGYEPSSWEAQSLLLKAKELGGDPLEAIDQAHTDYEAFMVEKSKNYVSQGTSPEGETALLPDGGSTAAETDPSIPGATAEERMRARLDELDASPEDVSA
jgi:hypothetical protein